MQQLSDTFTRARSHREPAERLTRLLGTIFGAIFDFLRAEPDYWSLFQSPRSQPVEIELLANDLCHRTSALRGLIAVDL